MGFIGPLAETIYYAWASHRDALIFTQGTASGNLVANHMFDVLQMNLTQQSVPLDNPWKGSGVKSGLQMRFWEPLSTIGAIGGALTSPTHERGDAALVVGSAPAENWRQLTFVATHCGGT
jgi:hypothetical protein